MNVDPYGSGSTARNNRVATVVALMPCTDGGGGVQRGEGAGGSGAGPGQARALRTQAEGDRHTHTDGGPQA